MINLVKYVLGDVGKWDGFIGFAEIWLITEEEANYVSETDHRYDM